DQFSKKLAQTPDRSELVAMSVDLYEAARAGQLLPYRSHTSAAPMMMITSSNPRKSGAGSKVGMCGTRDAAPFSFRLLARWFLILSRVETLCCFGLIRFRAAFGGNPRRACALTACPT